MSATRPTIVPAARLIRETRERFGIEPNTSASEAIASAVNLRDAQWRDYVAATKAHGRWAVRFSNYEPAEIASIHDSEEEANAERDRLNREGDTSMWEVESGW